MSRYLWEDQYDTIENIHTIKNNNIENHHLDKLIEKRGKKLNRSYESKFRSSFQQDVGDFITNLFQGSIIFLGANMVLDSTLSVGSLFAFYLYSNIFVGKVKTILISTNLWTSQREQLSLLNELLNEKTDRNKSYLNDLEEIKSIVIRDLKHKTDERCLLDVEHLEVLNGDRVCITGTASSDKAILIKYLRGHLLKNTPKPKVLFNDIDIRNFTKQSLNDCVAVINSEEKIIPGTIRFNIRLREDNSNDGLFKEVIKIVNIEHRVLKLSMKFDSPIDSKTENISDTDKRKIILARALYKKPSVLIVDEYYLDSEQGLTHGVREFLRKNKITTFVTQHEFKNREGFFNMELLCEAGVVKSKPLLSGITVPKQSNI